MLVQAGIGRHRARDAVLAVSRLHAPGAAWSLGFAGGLTEDLGPGHLVCPAGVLLDDGRGGRSAGAPPAQVEAYARLGSGPMPVHSGPLLTVDAPLRTPAAKSDAHRRTGAIAVDMEAAGVAEAARDAAIPWLAIKAVVDPVQEPLPELLAGCTTPQGNTRWRGVAACLLAGGEPRQSLRRLVRASSRAALTLVRSVGLVLEDRPGALTPPPRSSRM
jgi:hypothetical protein